MEFTMHKRQKCSGVSNQCNTCYSVTFYCVYRILKPSKCVRIQFVSPAPAFYGHNLTLSGVPLEF